MNATRNLGRVARLWRYPASSLAGEELEVMAAGPEGAEGDRLFGLFDAATGEIARPDADRKWHNAPRIATRLDEGNRFEIRTPESGWLPPGAEADGAASRLMGFGVSIRKFQFGTADADAALPRYRKEPIHLLTTASLSELKAQHPGGEPDPRRFRPNILVDMEPVAGHFPETEWIGRRLAIGRLELTITEPCRRCGFTIIAQDGLDNDPDILRTLVRRNAHNLGVYCTVDNAATVEPGDTMRFLA